MLALLLASLAGPADAQYFGTIEDVPLAPALSETQPGYVFDAGAGRVVGAEASGPADLAGVRAFYVETLPALGWALSSGGDPLVFVRGREQMTLRIAEEGEVIRLRVELIVRSAY